MKRIYLWLREFSLSQQLVTIVFLVITVFCAFLMAVLTPSINVFTDNEMYRMLHSSQSAMEFYLKSYPEIVPVIDDDDNTSIIHGIYDAKNDRFVMLSSSVFSDDEQADIRANTALIENETADFQLTQINDGIRQEVLYTITPLENNRYLVSLMPASYETQFRALLVNNIINLNIVVVGILFFLLMLWISSLIRPLNQIKAYITHIRKDEPAMLMVDRRDEIGELADALREMEFELQKQKADKQEMIQNISHDLKTPIATIRSYGESIKDGIYPYGSLEKSIDVIIEHANRLEKKVRSLIQLNKMEYLLDDCPEGDNLNMSEVIDKVLLSLKVIRPEITFETNVDRDVRFHGDEDPWRIVVENLVDNALRYADSKVVLELNPGELKVSNDGKQIDADRKAKLFKPYEKGSDGQFGLGLSIVYKVVTTYGYKVEAENLPDGVCFRVWREVSKKELRAIQKERKKEEREQLRANKLLKQETNQGNNTSGS